MSTIKDEGTIMWNAYLKYLRDWADDHSDEKFYAMSPITFEEFVCNEYEEIMK